MSTLKRQTVCREGFTFTSVNRTRPQTVEEVKKVVNPLTDSERDAGYLAPEAFKINDLKEKETPSENTVKENERKLSSNE